MDATLLLKDTEDAIARLRAGRDSGDDVQFAIDVVGSKTGLDYSQVMEADAIFCWALDIAYRSRDHWRAKVAKERKKARARAAATPKFTRGHVSKAAVIARDGLACHLCGSDVDPANWHLEHVIPLALGGTDCLANAAVAHPSCKLAKSDSWAGSLFGERWAAAHVAYRKAHGKSYRGPMKQLAELEV